MLPFQFDHCNNYVLNLDGYMNLERLGFRLRPQEVSHPVTKTCRFVYFVTLKTTKEKVQDVSYIEFCSIGDPNVEFAHWRAKYPWKYSKVEDLFEPGFSLNSESSLDKLWEDHGPQWAQHSAKLTHKNYDWQNGEEPRRPGWNFLNFERRPVPPVYIWVTEYEGTVKDTPDRQRRIRETTNHPNGATSILGFIWDLDDKGENAAAEFFGSSWHQGRLPLFDGTQIFSKRHFPELRDPLDGKMHSFNAVVVGCQSISQFTEVSKINSEFRFQGSLCCQIKLEPSSWDILVVEQIA